jgi:16S rRNA (cytosine1402-N4)-methyltransferase
MSIELLIEMEEEIYHYPVMYREVIQWLQIHNKKIVVDCTIGVGSHALKFFEIMPKDGLLIGIDKDGDSLEVCRQRLKEFKDRLILVKDDFSNLDKILKRLEIDKVDAIFFDLGLSSYQLNKAERGFSFLKEGPLDMRMDRDSFLCAYDLVNNLSREELTKIFKKYGEEFYAKRIAHLIVEKRKRYSLSTTLQLVEVINQAIPYKRRLRIHPATKIFQALRIAVNRELECLKEALPKAISFLKRGARLGVISFHSLEDRIVKHTFKDFSLKGILKILTKKPVVASSKEIEENFSSRSAKLRVGEKIE